VAQRAQHGGLTDAGFAGEPDRDALLDRFDEVIDDALLGGQQPEIAVSDLLAEG
jgi:hypothetical protein